MSAIRTIFCLFLTCMILEMSSGRNYCDICLDHTMCKPHWLAPNCPHYAYRLTQDQKNRILYLHNQLRRKVASGNEKRPYPGQPPAKYMPDLVWDNELENVAQTLANTCVFQHDTCRNVERFKVGQNIAWAGVGNADVTEKLLSSVTSWYDEVALFNPREVSHYRFDSRTAHYTQMVWAKTTKLGCGYVYQANGNVLLVCNYGPAGNYATQEVYEIRR